MKKIIVATVAGLLLTSSLSAVENKVYATVNGENITSQSIAVALKDPKVQFSTLPKETQKNVLDRIVEQKLLSQEAIKTDAVKDPMYLETLHNLKQDLALQVWMQQMSKKVKTTEKELKSFYDKNKKSFDIPTQLKARHILVKDEKTAKSIIKSLSKSKKLKNDFIAKAKTKSTGPSGANGGDLGWFTMDKMVPEFSKATNALKVGTITKKPVKTQFGFHIIYLEDKKKASKASYKEAKNQIKQEIGKQKFIEQIQAIVEELKKKAKITYK